jgi:hypothetical protein
MEFHMIKLQNRKMPTRRTAYGYLALACFLTFLFGLQPTAALSAFLAISFATAGVLSIPRITYPKVLIHLVIVGLIPTVAIYYLTKAPYLCLAAFAVIPATALLALTIRKRYSRSAGILWATVALGTVLLAALLFWVHHTHGGISITVFKSLYHKWSTSFVDQLAPMLNTEDQSLFMTPIDPQEYLSELFEALAVISPAIFIVILWLGVWLSTVIIRWIFMNYVYGADRFANWPVTANRPLAWVYLASFLVASLMAAFSANNVFYTISAVANNIYLILMPTFVIIGCRTIKERMQRVPGCGCMTVMMIITCLFALSMLPTLLAFTGAFHLVSPKPIMPPPRFQSTDSDHSDDPDNSDDSETPTDQGGNAS